MSLAPDFEVFMRAQGPRIYTLASRLCGNAADGQDLAQETFVKAYEHWSRFRGEADPGTWLYRICVNTWKNRVRYEKRRSFWKHVSLTASADEEGPALELAASEAPMGQAIEAADREEAVQQALDRLDPQERLMVVLRDIEDRSYEEIAESLQLPLGTVKSRLARSREKLRQLLERHLRTSL